MKIVLLILSNLIASFLIGNDFLAATNFDTLKSGYIIYQNNDTLYGNLKMMTGAHKNNVFIESEKEGNKKVSIEKLKLIVYGEDAYKIFLLDTNMGERLYYAKMNANQQSIKLFPSYCWTEKNGASSGSPIVNSGPIKTILNYAYLIQIKDQEPIAILKNTIVSDEKADYKKKIVSVFAKNEKAIDYISTMNTISFDEIPYVIEAISTFYK